MKDGDKKHDASLMIQPPQRINSNTCDVISATDACSREFATLCMQGSMDEMSL